MGWRLARWLVPWACVLAIACGLAGALDLALRGQPPAQPAAPAADTTLVYVGQNTWIWIKQR